MDFNSRLALLRDRHEALITRKNIPIEGNITDFISKLKLQGFTLEESMSNGAILKGPFVGYDNCTVYVLCSKSSKTVWKVVASLPSQVSWSSTRSRYEDFKEIFEERFVNCKKPTFKLEEAGFLDKKQRYPYDIYQRVATAKSKKVSDKPGNE